MRAFKTTPQTGVAMTAIAIAITGHLVDRPGSFDGCLVRFFLSRLSQARVRELGQRQDGRKSCSLGWDSRVKRRDLGRLRLGLTRELRMRHGSTKNNGGKAKKVFHNAAILPQNRHV